MDNLFLSIFVGVITAILTCLLWRYRHFGYRYLAIGKNKLKRGYSSGSKDEQRKRNKTPGEKSVPKIHEARLNDNQSVKSDAVESDLRTNDAPEMTMKERFNLFLEKGFCPELEQGAEDPMYKRFGGRMKDRNTESKNLDPMDMFCPFAERETSKQDDSELDGEDTPKTNPRHAEADALEKMLKMAAASGGKCPFFGKPPDESGEEKESCPFDFGLRADADSEDEADVPASHKGENAACPSLKQKVVKAALFGDASEELGQTDNSTGEEQISTLKAKQVLSTLNSVLSQDELMKETKVREEQLAAILKLLTPQAGGLGVEESSEIRSQLNMYM